MAKAKQSKRSAGEAKQEASQKPRRLRKTASTVAKPLRAAKRVGGKEYYLPLPDNSFGRFLNKRRSLIPSYFRDSFSELRQTSWPSRKETRQLTIAVFLFALVFGLVISITDYGLDKIFRKVILK